jgi:uroporphyrin-III C-methyltransferase/precorrin-2 dehydrogenase/sirohydrochlorin ferrochelatase
MRPNCAIPLLSTAGGAPHIGKSVRAAVFGMTEQRLSVFPAFHKVSNRPVLVVGDGPQAAAKLRLLGETDAPSGLSPSTRRPSLPNSRVVQTWTTVSALSLRTTSTASCWPLPQAESGSAMRSGRCGARPQHSGECRRYPELCDFYTPALVNRAPVAVAITSTGAGPVLAQKIRARIEVLLPARLGLLASLGESFRAAADRVLPQGQPRRRFWSSFFEGRIADSALAGRNDEARRLATRLLAEADGAENGFVWLVGAGPGAADLLTLRAQRVLGEADVIVHDSLVPDAVVAMGRRDAERIDVGKRKGRHKASQAEINAILVREGQAGRRVVRLKSGDPLVFGRAGEEMAALRQAGCRSRSFRASPPRSPRPPRRRSR